MINLSQKKLKIHNQIAKGLGFQLAGLHHIRAMIELGHLNKTDEEIADAKNKKEEKMITLKSESGKEYTVKQIKKGTNVVYTKTV